MKYLILLFWVLIPSYVTAQEIVLSHASKPSVSTTSISSEFDDNSIEFTFKETLFDSDGSFSPHVDLTSLIISGESYRNTDLYSEVDEFISSLWNLSVSNVTRTCTPDEASDCTFHIFVRGTLVDVGDSHSDNQNCMININTDHTFNTECTD